MNVTKTITIDLNRPRKNTVHLEQGDNTREIHLVLLCDGVPYAPEEGLTGVTKSVKYIASDGSGDENTGGVTAVTGKTNEYIVKLNHGETNVPGFAEVFVVFSKNGDILHTFPITLDIIQTDPEISPSDSSYGMFLRKNAQATKTVAMTQAVGVGPDGKLWVPPGGGGGGTQEVLTCSITRIGATYSCDQTFADIIDAASGGMVVQAITPEGTAYFHVNDYGACFDLLTDIGDVFSTLRYIVASTGDVMREVIQIDNSAVSGGGGANFYIVSINSQGAPDKTSSEIYTAWQSGYIIRLRTSGGVEYDLQSINSTRAIFQTTIDAGTSVQVDAYTIQGSTATHSTLNGYIKPVAGIPRTDLAVYATTITDTGAGYTADHSLADILAANTAGKLLVFMFGGMDCHVDEVASSVVRVHAVDEATAGQPTLYTFIITGTGVAGTETAISGGGSADAVTYATQTGKTDAEKAQARTNIGASAEPTVVTVTGNTPSITPADNTIYDCTGDAITSVTVSSYSYGVSFTLMFNIQPNTTPTITIDSKIAFPDGFAFEANRSYEINVNGKGRAVVGAWVLVD